MKHSSEELSRAIDESFVEAFATLCASFPKAILRNEGDMILYSSGAPNALLNGILLRDSDFRTNPEDGIDVNKNDA